LDDGKMERKALHTSFFFFPFQIGNAVPPFKAKLGWPSSSSVCRSVWQWGQGNFCKVLMVLNQVHWHFQLSFVEVKIQVHTAMADAQWGSAGWWLKAFASFNPFLSLRVLIDANATFESSEIVSPSVDSVLGPRAPFTMLVFDGW
jgi:hypothetical protein